MKKHVILQLFTVIALSALVSCGDLFNTNVIVGEGEVIAETRIFSGFSKIKSEIGADINIIESDESKIVITIQENLLAYLSTKVSSGVLTITFDGNSVSTKEGIVIDIYTSTVDKFTLTGAGDIDSALPIGNILLTGAGNFKCKGSLSNFEASITGVCNFNFYEMPVQNATIRISGTGDVKVQVSNSLNVTISGVGNVYYKGYPQVSTTISGIGNVVNSN